MNKEVKVMLAVGALIILGSIWFFVKSGGSDVVSTGAPVDNSLLIRTNSRAIGKIPNKVVLVEFGDFQCPACAAVEPTLKAIIAEYKDNPNFSFVFREFPLRSIHENAELAAESAEAAGAQGKFWEMHDQIYERQKDWQNSNNALDIFVEYAKNIGIDSEKFKTEILNGKYRDIVNQDVADAEKLQLNSTPTIFINSEKMTGVPSFAELKAKIDQALK